MTCLRRVADESKRPASQAQGVQERRGARGAGASPETSTFKVAARATPAVDHFGLAAGILALIAVVLAFGYVREILVRPTETAAVIGDQTISIGQLVQRVRPQLSAIDNEMARLASQGATVPTSNSPTDQNSRQYQMLRSQRPSTADQVLQDMIDEELRPPRG